MPPRPGGAQVSSGRRRYLLYQYGNHFWIPEIIAEFSKGMIRDTARVAIPVGAVYDSADYLLHQPGVAQKRGGTTYTGNAVPGAAYIVAVKAMPAPGGQQLMAIGSNGHLFRANANGTIDDIGALGAVEYGQTVVSPGADYLVFGQSAAAAAQKFDGLATISTLDTAGLFSHFTSYKARLVGALSNRLFFSPTPDVNATWDTANAWIDANNIPSGFASLNNSLLIFSDVGMERIIGATPPPNSDMDLAQVSNIGCTDHRSIVTVGPYVYFANPQGVFFTNGSTPIDLTATGGISNYWRSLLTGYVTAAPIPFISSWTIAAGYYRGFLFVSVANAARINQATLMCNLATRAWWRLTNINALAYATSMDGSELYYGNGDTNRVTKMSGIFSPSATNKLDANGTAVTPSIEFAPVGAGPGVKNYGFGRLDFDMRDAGSDNPTMAVTIKTAIEADTTRVPVESPLTETLTVARPRFSICQDSQACTISLAQLNASSKTELYSLEVEQRPQSMVGDGIS